MKRQSMIWIVLLSLGCALGFPITAAGSGSPASFSLDGGVMSVNRSVDVSGNACLTIIGMSGGSPKGVEICGFQDQPGRQETAAYCEKGATLALTSRDKAILGLSFTYATQDAVGLYKVNLAGGNTLTCEVKK